MGIVKIRAFCGQKFKNPIFYGAFKDFSIQSTASMDLCFLNLILIRSIILFLSSDGATHSSTVLAGASAVKNPPTQQWPWHSTHIWTQTPHGGRQRGDGSHKEKMGRKKTKRDSEDTKKKIGTTGSSSCPVSALEDSVVSQADWQTAGRKLGNVEGMWMKECIYRFCPGIARNILGIFLFCRAHAPPHTRPSQCSPSLRVAKKKCDIVQTGGGQSQRAYKLHH